MGHELQATEFSTYFKSEEEANSTGLTGWRELVMQGYGFSGDESYAQEQFRIEYTKPQESRIIALSDKGRVIASIVLAKSDIFPDITSYGIHGIVVLPQYKGQGIGKRLYQEAAGSENIQIICGSTKTPSAVTARASGTAMSGMRTFYGKFEVTSSQQNGPSNLNRVFLNQYLLHKKDADLDSTIFFRDTDILPPNIPNLDTFPDYLRKAFEPVIRSQLEVDSKKTAVMPLLSIRKELLDANRN